ncbi:MAG: aminotransferase class IV, partial [Oceanicaulis sp.]
MSEVWLDGAFVNADAAHVSITDRGFLLGDAAFETMRFETGGIRRWPRHRARLSGALDFLRIAPPDWAVIEAAAARLAAPCADAVLRLTVTRGAYGGGLDAPDFAPGRALLTAAPRKSPPAALTLVTIPEARRAGLASERFKLSGYAEPLLARRLAKDRGADMGVLVSAIDGSPVCADCASLFWIETDRVFTPKVSAGALPGTARAALIEAASGQGIEIRERRADPGLARADAAFVTNAAIGLVPVATFDGRLLEIDHELVSTLRG